MHSSRDLRRGVRRETTEQDGEANIQARGSHQEGGGTPGPPAPGRAAPRVVPDAAREEGGEGTARVDAASGERLVLV